MIKYEEWSQMDAPMLPSSPPTARTCPRRKDAIGFEILHVVYAVKMDQMIGTGHGSMEKKESCRKMSEKQLELEIIEAHGSVLQIAKQVPVC